MTAAIASVSPNELADWLEDLEEIALIDVREQGDYAQGHLLFASSLPLSRLELMVERAIPRKSTRIVLCDQGDGGLVVRAAVVLSQMGYTNLYQLAGGVVAWSDAGYRTFSGIYVPSKAFGEIVEHYYDTPNIDPDALARMVQSGDNVKIFDCRPKLEFRRMSIPGAVNCPGGELLLRLPEILPSRETVVVVNCAGRTRSILGAQTLINGGISNPVMALRNGTMGWQLAGYEVDRARDNVVSMPGKAGQAQAKDLAQAWAEREAVRSISWDTYLRMGQDADRTTYLFDVRDIEEYQAGTPEGAVLAPAGQLVQATDSYVGTLKSRIVVFDDKKVRAIMAATWLAKAGWDEVYILTDAPQEVCHAPATGPIGPAPVISQDRVMSPSKLAAQLDDGSVWLLDLATSPEFLNGHIAGAHFCIRSRMMNALSKLDPEKDIVLTSPDGVLAAWALPEVVAVWPRRVHLLSGGTQGWQLSGMALDKGFQETLEPPTDLWHTPSSEFGGGKAAMAEYIEWETGLIPKLKGEPGLRFRLPY
jgi:rhodanese-related sulfurtransferase